MLFANDDKKCIDISSQLTAIESGVKKINFEILENHINKCIKDSNLKSVDNEDINELLTLLQRYFRNK